MREELSPECSNKFIGFDQESVERFFIFKMQLRTVNNVESAVHICKSAGVYISDIEGTLDLTKVKKIAAQRLWSIYFPVSSSEKEQREKQKNNIRALVDYLKQNNSLSTLWVGGSYATGKSKDIFSDLDFYFCIPRLSNENEVYSESKIFKGLDATGLIISEQTSPFRDVLPVLKSGKGLFRLSGVTKDGVEVDIHGMGIEDLRNMDKLRPGVVSRVREVGPYQDYRTSFTGNKKILPKSSDKIFHYLKEENETFKGNYLDNFSALGQLI